MVIVNLRCSNTPALQHMTQQHCLMCQTDVLLQDTTASLLCSKLCCLAVCATQMC